MTTERVDSAGVMDALAALRREVSRLSERVAALEASGAAAAKPATPVTHDASVPVAAVEPSGPSEELLLIIGAAVAGYLGVRPHIRQIRLIGSIAWAQQGRLTIQASHGHEPRTAGR
jgi:methylmalonyl-CoA carboxyltransferase large subunit